MAEILTPDLCVIGGGIGGLTAAAEARALGASVVLVERDRLGGDDLNTGTIPSKALAAAAAHAHAMRTAPAFGIAADEPRVNTRRVHDHVEGVIASLRPRDAAERLAAMGTQVLHGTASFADPRTVAVGDISIRARRFVIATGARSLVPPIPGLDRVPYFTSETIFDNTRKLTHLVIVGGGPVGLELAQSYGRLGTQVTVIVPGAALAGFDPELAAVVLARLREERVDIREHATVAAVQARSQGIGVLVQSAEGEAVLDVSHVMVALERVPNLDLLALDKAGIRRRKADPRRLELSRGLRTTNRRVYAIGEAAGGAASGPTAAFEARLVVRSALLGIPDRPARHTLPRIVQTDPELAEIGLTEPEARARHQDRFTILRASFADNDRARATRATYGLAKLIVAPGGRILGAGVVGERAGELAALFSLAIANRLDMRSLARFEPPHPTFAAVARTLGTEYLRSRGVATLVQRLVALVRLTP